ncbi:hypothetical protein M422DRAFT_130777, partial [Sphaerobolus stellatus SS14]
QSKSETLKLEGNEAFQRKDFEHALQRYQEALDLDPSNHLLWSNMSATKVELKDYTGSI